MPPSGVQGCIDSVSGIECAGHRVNILKNAAERLMNSSMVGRPSANLLKLTETSVAHHIKGIRPALSVMQNLGFTATQCLAGSGITLAQLEQSDQGISLEQEFAFYRQLLALSHDPLLGLQLGKAYRLENYGMLGYAILSAPTLGDALTIARDFGPLSFSHFQVDFAIHPHEACIIMRQNKYLDSPLLQLYEDRDCAAIIHGTRLALASDFPLLRIELMHAPCDQAAYADFFGCPVLFEQAHMAIYFPADILARPMPLRDPETSEYCRQQCQHLLNKISRKQSLTSQVKQLLEANQTTVPDLPALCAQLGLSERSLRRKLTEEGEKFQDILNEVRFTTAKHLLKGNDKLEDIALRLGYSEAGNFSHAFKRWSGISPKAYREQMSKQ
jgi:AraC-like DNA-binding protein